ncbi:single-stranded DNA-binding protein [Colwellia sp. MSW7]|uniref:Single-stranded DNA-binding protein n=1 Tax=Colwellia maritima TaxID=2912588 RepID=A0ABS9X9C1_9GAMM|nr:single-stranded DNA-binding protein [Colwellia maritima]MCI2286076.1 single-stranded DNA-binding protein [Colwellia maritima]
MRGLFEITAIGHLGSDPTMSKMPSGDLVANFSIAITECYKDGNGDHQDRTEWFKCHAIGEIAKVVQRLCQKGTQVHLKAAYKGTKWVSRNKVHHLGFELRIQNIIVLNNGKCKKECVNPAKDGLDN